MSKSVPQNRPIKPTGVVFGNVSTMNGEQISAFLHGESSQLCSMVLHSFHADHLVRFKLSQLREFRDMLDKAITFMEANKKEWDAK